MIYLPSVTEKSQKVSSASTIMPKLGLLKITHFKLTCANLYQCFNACNINTAWSAFRDIFILILVSVVPVKEIRLNQRAEPWITSKILNLIKQRDDYLYQFKQSNF